MPYDPTLAAHREWLGYVQPQGLVVSVPALLAVNAAPYNDPVRLHRCLLDLLPADAAGEPVPELRNFREFAEKILYWPLEFLHGAPGHPSMPDDLCAFLDAYGETLRPTYALADYQPKDPSRPWLLLVREVPPGTPLDDEPSASTAKWVASPQSRFERLLKETRIPIGILTNLQTIRLVYAPTGESSGHVTFDLSAMVEVAGRPILAALQMMLGSERLYSLGEKERLPALLESSRKFQNKVSTELAGQVLEALYHLLRGFQTANDAADGVLLREALAANRNDVYAGLVTVLLRLVFLLYAEDRELLPADPVYQIHYSVGGLFEQLRDDDAQHHDTMDQRYGAWARLIALFRLIHDGGSHGDTFRIPRRRGYLFDRERYPFLEGHGQLPRISDGVIFRVLRNLLILDGERLSYRALDVEHIGSVYEAIMGFELHTADGLSIALKPPKSGGAPLTINLEALLATSAAKRPEWLKKNADQKLTGSAETALKEASSTDGLLAALQRRIHRGVTPNPVPKGGMIFQPSAERRRSGSHYTPRTLTGPIVQHTLAPILQRLGPNPEPGEILALKVCDPAIGSGAFLVEVCRQLGAKLADAWASHGETPPIPPDEDILLHAQRTVAQRCLYGVDKNPLAADLAKLSLWLATLAKDHPFTFLDHAIRCGDSLVGFDADAISRFRWDSETSQQNPYAARLKWDIELAMKGRAVILDAPEGEPYENRRQKLDWVDQQLENARLTGDVLAAAFFLAAKPRERERLREELAGQLNRYFGPGADLEAAERLEGDRRAARALGVVPFHWQIEFPEVFRRGGFDAIVGNPPFAGKNTIAEGQAPSYGDWLKTLHAQSHGNADLVAHFYRRAFTLLRPGGCFGLIATNTIGQGDTRSTGLRWICLNGGNIYRARKRLKWPGEAAVVVSLVHVTKGDWQGKRWLDAREVDRITAYLFHDGGNEDPEKLAENANKSFIGSTVLGMGFTFDDTDRKGVASPIAEMDRVIAKDPRNAERIFPYLGGEEINDSPTHAHHRYVINFEDFPLEKAREWPDLLRIVKERVKPERERNNRENYRHLWWRFGERRPGLKAAVESLTCCFAVSRVSPHWAVGRIPAGCVPAESVVVFPFDTWPPFTVLQSRVHEVWARFMASSMKDDLRYTPSDCFETYPFPRQYEASAQLADIGERYYTYRARLMVRTNLGLTKTYNRFHDPEETSEEIAELRRLHEEMDRAVLDAYGWSNLPTGCDFFPEFEDEEEEDDEGGRPRILRKKFRYRWPDEIRDQALARLLKLNQQRAAAQSLPARPPAGTHAAAPRKQRSTPTNQMTLE